MRHVSSTDMLRCKWFHSNERDFWIWPNSLHSSSTYSCIISLDTHKPVAASNRTPAKALMCPFYRWETDAHRECITCPSLVEALNFLYWRETGPATPLDGRWQVSANSMSHTECTGVEMGGKVAQPTQTRPKAPADVTQLVRRMRSTAARELLLEIPYDLRCTGIKYDFDFWASL